MVFDKSKHKLRALMALGLAVAIVPVCIVVAKFDPSQFGFYPRCFFHQATGLHCPGCGVTRALHHLLNGRVDQAFFMNPLLFLAMPFLVLLIFIPSLTRRPMVPFLAALILISYGILRNIPSFSFLAP